MCKPIKNGVTNYALVFFKSAYLYRWRWHLGKGASPAAHGQPTDTDALDEEDEVQLGYIRGMMDELIGPEFNNTGAIGFFDKAFTSIKLLAALAARGVRAVGMLRAKRPKAMRSSCSERCANKKKCRHGRCNKLTRKKNTTRGNYHDGWEFQVLMYEY